MFTDSLSDQDVTEIQLKHKQVKQINNDHLKQMMIDYLFQKYNIKMTCTNKYFRMIDTVNDLPYLQKYKHLAYINTNQPLWLMVLTKFSDKRVCLLVDKHNCSFYCLNCQFSPSLYEDTIFEGEIVGNYFLISDFLVYLNKNITTHAMDKRVILLQSIISPKNYNFDKFLDPFKILAKDFVEYSKLLSFVEDHIQKLPYKNFVSGIIFRQNENGNRNLIHNLKFCHSKSLNDDVIKTMVVESEANQDAPLGGGVSINTRINIEIYTEAKFLLFETGNPDDYCLKLYDAQNCLYEYDYALINDMTTSRYFQRILEEIPESKKNNGVCVMCRYVSSFKKWKPITVLDDEIPDNIINLYR